MTGTATEAQVQQLVELLQRNKIFDNFRGLQEFARRADVKVFEQSRKVVNQGDPGDQFFMVMSGQVRAVDIEHSPPKLLNYLAPGQIFGTRSLLDKAPRSATVEVVLDATLAVFEKDDWDWLLLQQDRFEDYFRNLEREFERRALLEFPGRQWDEVVVYSVKRHVLVLVAKMAWPVVLLIAPVIFLISAELLGLTFVEIFTVDLLFTLLFNVPFVVVAALLAVYNYLDWRNDDLIVTTKRVVHIERILFYGEKRDEAPLTRIQDVTVLTFDLLERFFDYHDILIKTAGAGVIRVTGIPDANEIREVVFRERRRAQERVSAADVSAIRQLIARQLNLEEKLDQPVMAVAEAEAALRTHQKTYHLPWYLDYFLPRMKEVSIGDDSTIITWRKHYFVLLMAVFLPALAALGTIYLAAASAWGFFPFRTPLPTAVAGMIGLAALSSWVWLAARYDGWQRDLYIVTDRRIIDIEGTPFRLRGEQRREGTFDTIQNITYNIPNLFSQLLNLGDVVIETAGTEATFTFKQVFNPSAVQEEIFNRMVLFQQHQREQSRDVTTSQLVEYIAEYHRLMERTGELPKKS